MNPYLQDLLHEITTSIDKKITEHENKIKELEKEIQELRKAQEK